ncbi:MAG: APC family permease, partial [Pseudoxanthomonas sp.]
TELVLVWLAVGVNLLGVRAGGRVQLATTVLKLLPMAMVIMLGLWLLAAQPQAWRAPPPATPAGLHGVAGAATLALFAMLGIESASLSAARARDPQRTVARATVLGTALAGAVSLAVCALPILLLPQAELAASGAPFALLLERYLGIGAGRWLALFVVVSGLGALNGWTLLAGEVSRSLAVRGAFPRMFAAQNRHGAPAPALLGCGVLASALLAMGASRTLVGAFTFLSNLTTLASLPLYLGCALALLVLWRRGARTPGALPACALGLGLVAFAVYGAGTVSLLMAAGLILAGLPPYLLARRRAVIDPAQQA